MPGLTQVEMRKVATLLGIPVLSVLKPVVTFKSKIEDDRPLRQVHMLLPALAVIEATERGIIRPSSTKRKLSLGQRPGSIRSRASVHNPVEAKKKLAAAPPMDKGEEEVRHIFNGMQEQMDGLRAYAVSKLTLKW